MALLRDLFGIQAPAQPAGSLDEAPDDLLRRAMMLNRVEGVNVGPMVSEAPALTAPPMEPMREIAERPIASVPQPAPAPAPTPRQPQSSWFGNGEVDPAAFGGAAGVNAIPGAAAPRQPAPMQAPAAVQPSMAPSRPIPAQASPSMGERLGAFLAAGGPGSIAHGIAAATTGLDRQTQTQNDTVRFLVSRGLPADQATAAARNPTIMQAILPQLVGPKNQNVKLGSGDAIFGPDGRLIARNEVPKPKDTPFGLAEQPDGTIVNRPGYVDAIKEQASAKGEKPTKSVGQDALDRTFAKDYAENYASGGLVNAQKNIAQLKVVADELGRRKDLTGPLLGKLPDAVANVVNPDQVDRRQLVEDVVQRSLKPILGGQFTEKEGKQLVERAYNPSQPEAVNEKRVRALALALEEAAANKLKAAQYFEANGGTLRGFEAAQSASVSDIMSRMDEIYKAETPKPGADAPAGRNGQFRVLGVR